MLIDGDLRADVHNALIACALLYDERGDYSLGDEIMGLVRRFDAFFYNQFPKPSSGPSDSPAAQETSNPPATK